MSRGAPHFSRSRADGGFRNFPAFRSLLFPRLSLAGAGSRWRLRRSEGHDLLRKKAHDIRSFCCFGIPTLRQQLGNLDIQHIGNNGELEVSHPASPALDPGDDVPGDIPSGELAFGGKLRLRPAVTIPDAANLRAGDIECFLSCVKIHTGHYFGRIALSVWFSTRFLCEH